MLKKEMRGKHILNLRNEVAYVTEACIFLEQET